MWTTCRPSNRGHITPMGSTSDTADRIGRVTSSNRPGVADTRGQADPIRYQALRPEIAADAEIDDVPPPPPTQLRSKRGLMSLGICLVLIGLNLRTVCSSFSAVLPEITSDAGLPGWA